MSPDGSQTGMAKSNQSPKATKTTSEHNCQNTAPPCVQGPAPAAAAKPARRRGNTRNEQRGTPRRPPASSKMAKQTIRNPTGRIKRTNLELDTWKLDSYVLPIQLHKCANSVGQTTRDRAYCDPTELLVVDSPDGRSLPARVRPHKGLRTPGSRVVKPKTVYSSPDCVCVRKTVYSSPDTNKINVSTLENLTNLRGPR